MILTVLLVLFASLVVLTFTPAALESLSGPRLLPGALRPVVNGITAARGPWPPTAFGAFLLALVCANELYFLIAVLRISDLSTGERSLMLWHIVAAVGWGLYLLRMPRQP